MALLSPQPPIDLRPAAVLRIDQLLPDTRFRAGADPAARDWLLHDGSLTERIRRRHGPVRVRLDREGIGMPSAFEARLLDQPRRGGWWIREITMSADGTARLRARTLVPPDAPKLRTRLMGLGRTPLGQLLFRADRLRPEVIRRGRGYLRIPAPGSRHDAVPRTQWLRLTHYRVGDESLLVIERPLPSLLAAAAEGPRRADAGGRR